MSTDYHPILVIGYVVPVEDFFRDMVEVRPATFDEEERFDPKTGKSLGRIRVETDPRGLTVVIKERRFDVQMNNVILDESFMPDDDVFKALGELLDCSVSATGDHCNGCFWMCLEPIGLPAQLNGVIPLNDIVDLAQEAEAVGKRCRALLGVDPGVLGVHTLLDVC